MIHCSEVGIRRRFVLYCIQFVCLWLWHSYDLFNYVTIKIIFIIIIVIISAVVITIIISYINIIVGLLPCTLPHLLSPLESAAFLQVYTTFLVICYGL